MIDAEEFAYVNRQLSGLLRAGIPLEKGLKRIAVSGRKELKDIFSGMEEDLSGGMPLNKVLEKHRSSLPPLYIDLCIAGLSSGSLPEALERFSSFSIEEKSFRDNLRIMTIYPIIVLCFSIIVALILFALPGSVIETVSTGAASLRFSLPDTVSLPFILTNSIILFCIVILAVLPRISMLYRHRFLWFFPPARHLKLAVLSSMLEYLSRSGVEEKLIPGIIKDLTSDTLLQRFMENLELKLQEGIDIVRAVSETAPQWIPRTWIWLLESGGNQGTIAQGFAHQKEYYRGKADFYMQVWLRGMLPALSCAVGIFVFLNILACIRVYIPALEAVLRGIL